MIVEIMVIIIFRLFVTTLTIVIVKKLLMFMPIGMVMAIVFLK